MGRAPCCDKASVKRGPWSPEEDQKLKEYIEKHGTGGNWISLPQKAGLKRCGKSCRLRWLNYLRPNIKHGEFSEDEDRLICSLFSNIGSRWSIIAGQLPGRTDNDIKNYWNTKLKKKLIGIVSSSSSTSSQKRALHPPTTHPSYNNSINNLFTGYAPISVQASPMPQEQEPYVAPTQNYHFKDHNSILSFGGGDQASCSASSDGSYNNNNNNQIISHEITADHHETMVTLERNYNNDLFGETQIDYSSLEEIKQLISTSNVSSNLNNFFVDEKVLYY